MEERSTSGLPPAVTRVCARLRRWSPAPWIIGIAVLLALSTSERVWTGPLAYLFCAASVTMGLAGLVALLFSEDTDGRKDHDPLGVTLGLIGVVGAFGASLAAMLMTPRG